MQTRFELMVVAGPGHDSALDLWNEASGDIHATRNLYVQVTATRVMVSENVERRIEGYVLSGVYDPRACSFDTLQDWRRRVIAMARYLDEMHCCVLQTLTFHNVELVDVRDDEYATLPGR